MFVHLPPKERVVYVALASVFLFGAGYVGAQRLRQPPKIVFDIPNAGGKSAQFFPSSGVDNLTQTAPLGTAVVVDVVGAVKAPGLRHLPAGSRIDDAVKAAGGPTAEADLDEINLAAKLEDGQQVSIPAKGDGGSTPGAAQAGAGKAKGGKHPDHPLDLNSSSFAQLEELPGVGPSMAEKLMAYRLQHGHLSFQDLRAIPGLGPKKLEKIKPWVRGSG